MKKTRVVKKLQWYRKISSADLDQTLNQTVIPENIQTMFFEKEEILSPYTSHATALNTAAKK